MLIDFGGERANGMPGANCDTLSRRDGDEAPIIRPDSSKKVGENRGKSLALHPTIKTKYRVYAKL
jgi:hypothetical protein